MGRDLCVQIRAAMNTFLRRGQRFMCSLYGKVRQCDPKSFFILQGTVHSNGHLTLAVMATVGHNGGILVCWWL